MLEDDIRKAATALTEEGRMMPREIAVVLVTERESRNLNQRFLKKRRPANVLAFHYGGMGEIIIAPAVIRREAGIDQRSYQGALRRMLVHGLLHLSGGDHSASRRSAKTFADREQRLVRRLGIP